jgi:hypothetical protein
MKAIALTSASGSCSVARCGVVARQPPRERRACVLLSHTTADWIRRPDEPEPTTKPRLELRARSVLELIRDADTAGVEGGLRIADMGRRDDGVGAIDCFALGVNIGWPTSPDTNACSKLLSPTAVVDDVPSISCKHAKHATHEREAEG